MEEAIAVLEKRVEIDRALRDGSVESDYDKFCENECLAIEKVINGYRKVINGEDILKEAVKENLEFKEYMRELEEKLDSSRKANELLNKTNNELRLEIRTTYSKVVNDIISKFNLGDDFIPKSKIKEFFTSRLEKYQEADDGSYEQDYLTRGELELVDRYKECKEIARILLEEEIEPEIPQNCISKSRIKEKIEELKQHNYKGNLDDIDFINKITNELQELLEE